MQKEIKMNLEMTFEIESCKRRIRFFFYSFVVSFISFTFFCISVCEHSDKLNERILLLEQQQKSMQDKSNAEFDDLNDQISGLYKRVQELEEQSRKNSQHIWL